MLDKCLTRFTLDWIWDGTPALVDGQRDVVKNERRWTVDNQPYVTKDEAIAYVDLMPDGRHRQYSSLQECKSVVTTPSGGQVLLDRGYYQISGLAWSGRGKVKHVDVSVDGGRNWKRARLEGPVMSKCLTRFNIDWVWNGKPAWPGTENTPPGSRRSAWSRSCPLGADPVP